MHSGFHESRFFLSNFHASRSSFSPYHASRINPLPPSVQYPVNNDVSVNTYSSDSLMERKQENFNAGGKDVR